MGTRATSTILLACLKTHLCQSLDVPSQLRVEVDETLLPMKQAFYARHGLVSWSLESPSDKSPRGSVLLVGDRGVALEAAEKVVAESVPTGDGCSAVMLNLVARLRHDAGDLEGAVDAYLRALQVH